MAHELNLSERERQRFMVQTLLPRIISAFTRSRKNASRRVMRLTAIPGELLEVRQLLTNYYVDPVLGSDSNPGTLELPFLTVRNLSQRTAPGNDHFQNLAAGDTVFLREGLHDWSSLVESSPDPGDGAFFLQGVQGTAESPVRITAYPSEKPIVRARRTGSEFPAIDILQCSHIEVTHLEITGTFGPGLRIAETADAEIAHNYIHDVDGEQDNNLAGIYALSVERVNIHHNLLHDNYDHRKVPLGSPDINNRNIVIIGDGSDQISVFRNKIFNTPLADGRVVGAGVWIKHASELPGAEFSIHDNIVRNVLRSGVGGQTSRIHAHHNLLLNTGPFQIAGDSNILVHDLKLEGIRIDHNTFFNSQALSIAEFEGHYPAADFISFQQNILSDNATEYTAENSMIDIDSYGSDSDYQLVARPENLGFQENLYFNPNTELRWDLFSDGAPQEPLGGLLSFSEWQALGLDTDSVIADPQLDSSFIPQNPLAANAGWTSGDAPRLTMYIGHDLIRESDGANASSATLFRSQVNLATPLTVTLTVSDGTEIQVPATVTFPAGVAKIQIPISAVNDNRTEPTRAVQIFADTPGGLHTSEWIRVLQVSGNTTIAAPSINSPIGKTSLLRPALSWTSVAGASSYDVWVNRVGASQSPYFRKTVTNNSVTPTSDFGIGLYQMWVRSLSSDGQMSSWSQRHNFTVNTPVSIQTLTKMQGTSQPTLRWNALPGAAKYDVWLDNLTTQQSQYIRAPQITGTEWTPGTELPIGRYRIWVRGIDSSELAAQWSAARDFDVMPAPVVTGGANPTFDRTPEFRWNAVPGAIQYEVYVRNMINGSTTIHQKNIAATNWTPVSNLADGPYRWWVIAVNGQGFRSQWSAPVDIYVGGRSTMLAPIGTTSDLTPTFHWQTVEGAASYQIWVNRTDVASVAISLSGLSTTSHTPAQTLALGIYRVWIRAISATGEVSPWSNPLSFSVASIPRHKNSVEAVLDTSLSIETVQTLELSGLEARPSSNMPDQGKSAERSTPDSPSKMPVSHSPHEELIKHVASTSQTAEPQQSPLIAGTAWF